MRLAHLEPDQIKPIERQPHQLRQMPRQRGLAGTGIAEYRDARLWPPPTEE
jgi:hypothetical protein